MTRSLRPTLALVLALAAGACAGGSTPADTTADKAAIDTLRTNVAAAFGSGDPNKVIANYTSDAVVMPENAAAVVGQTAILEFYKGMMSSFTPSIMINTEETKIAGDWAYDRGTFMTTLTPKMAGVPQIMEHGKYLVVLAKQTDGSWKVAREIGNSNDALMPPPAAPMPPAAPKPTK